MTHFTSAVRSLAPFGTEPGLDNELHIIFYGQLYAWPLPPGGEHP